MNKVLIIDDDKELCALIKRSVLSMGLTRLELQKYVLLFASFAIQREKQF